MAVSKDGLQYRFVIPGTSSQALGRGHRRPHNERTRGKLARSWSTTDVADQAACLCIAPLAEADPRIAFTERSIADHSLAISAAARPSA